MSDTVDGLYLEWLYAQVAEEALEEYWTLLTQLHTKPFTYFVPNDDNRAQDGRELRFEFMFEAEDFQEDPAWADLECSILEMMVALSRRVAFESYQTSAWWFWVLIENLGFKQYTDNSYTSAITRKVDRALDKLNNRTYSRTGVGGLFPMRHCQDDQTEVEIWYQMSTYLLKSGYLDEVL